MAAYTRQQVLTKLDEVMAGRDKLTIMDAGLIKAAFDMLKTDSDFMECLVMSVARNKPDVARSIRNTLNGMQL